MLYICRGSGFCICYSSSGIEPHRRGRTAELSAAFDQRSRKESVCDAQSERSEDHPTGYEILDVSLRLYTCGGILFVLQILSFLQRCHGRSMSLIQHFQKEVMGDFSKNYAVAPFEPSWGSTAFLSHLVPFGGGGLSDSCVTYCKPFCTATLDIAFGM